MLAWSTHAHKKQQVFPISLSLSRLSKGFAADLGTVEYEKGRGRLFIRHGRETDFARLGFLVIFNRSPAAILFHTGKELASFGLTQRKKNKIGAAQYTQTFDVYIQKIKRERQSQYKIFFSFCFFRNLTFYLGCLDGVISNL